MPARIVVVTPEASFAEAIASALAALGHASIALTDSMRALIELEHPRRIELLIASIDFPEGKPTGLALARMGRLRRPDLRIMLIGSAAYEELVSTAGVFLRLPIAAAEVAAAAHRLLEAASDEAAESPPGPEDEAPDQSG